MTFCEQSMQDNDVTIFPPKHKKHNYCIDFIKGIACFFVVFMHCEFPGRLGMAVQAVSRFSVPFFFMVSGYFSYTEGKYDALRKIRHIAQITIFASLFYLLVVVAKHLVLGTQLAFSLGGLCKWLLFNQPIIISGHLWFLYALLYDYVLYALIVRFRFQKLAYWLIPVLFIVYIAMAQGAHLYGLKIPNMYYRNFLIEGLLLFMLGNWLHRNESNITKLLSDKILLIILAMSIIACLGERLLIGRDFGMNISTLPQVLSLFIFSLKNGTRFAMHPISYVGAKLSLFVYIIHICVWKDVVERVYRLAHVTNNITALYLKPVFVLLVTLLISYAIVFFMEYFRQMHTSQKVKS